MSDRKRMKAATESGRDRISRLPDEVLHRVLWFLPTREAVRTSMLARRWCDLWKSTRCLSVSHSWRSERVGRSERLVRLLAQNRGRPRIRSRSRRRGLPQLSLAHLLSVDGDGTAAAVDRLNKFVNRLLLVREHVPLDECKFSFCGYPRVDGAQVDSWIQDALSSHVQVLHAHLGTKVPVALGDWSLASAHLKVMELSKVKLKGYSLDFRSCPALEDIKMHACIIGVEMFFSLSLKHLKITRCNFTFGVITSISVPMLLSFELADCKGPTPVLHLMPSLERAYVKFGCFDEDYCWKGLGRDDFEDISEAHHHHTKDTNEGHHGEGVNEGQSAEATDENLCSECVDWDTCELCANCCGYYDDNRVLLFGLTRATHLELVPEYYMFTIKRDLRWCGTFSNLSTLVLHEWSLLSGFYALLDLLQRAPHLRMLTLKLHKDKEDHDHSVKGFKNLKQACKLMYLRFVEIEYKQADNMLWELLKILDAWGTSLVQCKLRRVSL